MKADALLAEQDPQALVADVIDHPLGHQELGQLGQAPGGERQVVLGRAGLGELLDLPPLAQRELRRVAALVLRVQRLEPVGIEVADHVHALRGQQHHLRAPPGHHRTAVPAHDPHQLAALIIIDLPHPHTLGHRPI